MEDTMGTDIKDWITKIESINLPRWHELPELALYLDQVLEFINEHISVVFISHGETNEKILTSWMINNYVKNNIMPPPIKKRYHKEHIAYIITITVLKQVSNLSDVSLGIKHLTSALGKIDAYNAFISFLENALKASTMELQQQKDISYFQTPVDLVLLPLKTAALAFASIMMSKYLLKNTYKSLEDKKNE